MYSTGHSQPSTDSINDYKTTYTTNSTHVTFVSTRAMNTGDSNDYVVVLVIFKFK